MTVHDRIKAWIPAITDLFWLCAGPAIWTTAEAADFADPVPGHSGLTHRGLSRMTIQDDM